MKAKTAEVSKILSFKWFCGAYKMLSQSNFFKLHWENIYEYLDITLHLKTDSVLQKLINFITSLIKYLDVWTFLQGLLISFYGCLPIYVKWLFCTPFFGGLWFIIF